MIGRRMTAILVAAALSVAVAGAQCISGENVPVKSRTRRLVNPNGRGIPNAEITVFDASRKVLYRTRSDRDGKFSIPRLKSNEYRWLNDKNFHIEIEASGYIRYSYILLPSGNSRKVKPLSLVPASSSLCNDMKIEVEDESAR